MRCLVCGGQEFYMTNPPKCVVCTVWRQKAERLQRFDVLTEYGFDHMDTCVSGDYVKYDDVIAMFNPRLTPTEGGDSTVTP